MTNRDLAYKKHKAMFFVFFFLTKLA